MTNDNERTSILKDYYLEIEKIAELHSQNITLPPVENLPEDILFYLRIEMVAQTKLVEKRIIEIFEQRRNEVIDYLQVRVEETSNNIQRAKYNHILFILTKDNTYCQKVINFYKKALELAFSETQKEFYQLFVDDIFKVIIELSYKIKFKMSELKTQIKSFLTDNGKCRVANALHHTPTHAKV